VSKPENAPGARKPTPVDRRPAPGVTAQRSERSRPMTVEGAEFTVTLTSNDVDLRPRPRHSRSSDVAATQGTSSSSNARGAIVAIRSGSAETSTRGPRSTATWRSPNSTAVDTRWMATLVGPKAVQRWLASAPSRRALSSASARNVLVVARSSLRAAAIEPAKNSVP
jgi:hypothetical protein